MNLMVGGHLAGEMAWSLLFINMQMGECLSFYDIQSR